MLTDAHMHTALTSFVEKHSPLPLASGSIVFINEGVFTSIKRMRTLMPVTPHGKYPNAATLELRGEWHYPVMMMNDCQLVEPDPPTIIVRDAIGGVVVRLKPKSLEEIETMLASDVFDLPHMQARIDEGKRAAERKALEVERKAFLIQRRMALDTELRAAVVAVVGEFGAEIDALSRRIAQRLDAQTFQVHTDVDEYRMVAALDAFADGEAALAREVGERVRRALAQRVV